MWSLNAIHCPASGLSLTHCALLIGRFPKNVDDRGATLYILDKHPTFKQFPSYDLTLPILSHFTITIGAQVTVDTEKLSIRIDGQ